MAGFTLRQLELFVALVDHRTLSSAAAAVHVSESGLSHAISTLEKMVGEQLCVRKRSTGVQLTTAGRHFAVRAHALLAEANEMTSDLAAQRGELVGPIELGCYAGFATTALPPVLDGFATAHPRIDLGLHIGSDDELIPRLFDGQLDVVLAYDMVLPEGLRRRKIYETEVMAVLPGDHPKSHLQAIELSALADEPFIMLDTVPSASNTRRVFAQAGVTPNVRVTVPNLELVRVLVGRGLGYGLLMWRPGYSSTTLEGRPVVMRPLSPVAGVNSVVGVWPTEMALSRRADALLTHLAIALGVTRRPNDRATTS